MFFKTGTLRLGLFDSKLLGIAFAISFVVLVLTISTLLTKGYYGELGFGMAFVVAGIFCLKDANRLLLIFIWFCVISGNLVFGEVGNVAGISIYPRDLFVGAVIILSVCRFWSGKRSLTAQEKFILFFLLLTGLLFVVAVIQRHNLESAGVEFRSLVIYWAVFSFIAYLTTYQRFIFTFNIFFAAISIYCILFLSIYLWPGNPLKILIPDYGAGYMELFRPSYASKSLFILFPFYVSLMTSPRIFSKWVNISFWLSMVVIILALSRASWLILLVSLPLQILYLKYRGVFLLKGWVRIFIVVFVSASLLFGFSLVSPIRFKILTNRIESLLVIKESAFGRYLVRDIGTLHSRYISYEMILEEIARKPILGHGLGEEIQRDLFSNLRGVFESSVDSSFLVFLHKGGIVFLGAFLSMMWSIMRKARKVAMYSRDPVQATLAICMLFSLLNTFVLSLQDLVFYSGLQIVTISFLFAAVVQWEVIFSQQNDLIKRPVALP
jgi:hypothetical protein